MLPFKWFSIIESEDDIGGLFGFGFGFEFGFGCVCVLLLFD